LVAKYLINADFHDLAERVLQTPPGLRPIETGNENVMDQTRRQPPGSAGRAAATVKSRDVLSHA
jgi:hypothetical protein